MRAYDLIIKKRDGGRLTNQEIDFFINGYTRGDIPDYQMAAMSMAIFIRGMDEDELSGLTMTMARSGRITDLSSIRGIKVDKHSTGGVGDTTTLVVAPWVAACGIPVAKMSGRGLGHSGGTLDKLSSIPGFRVDLSMDRFIENVSMIGIAVIGQTEELAPADKKLYALRDVTATIESVPLIASSIMSKKIAGGADAIVLDVKTGLGAFMKDLEQARDLAKAMVSIGKQTGKQTVALITDMEQPLGSMIGNSLEVKEAFSILRREDVDSDLFKVSLALGSEMLVLGGMAGSLSAASDILIKKMKDGSVLNKMKEFIASQGGDSRVVENPQLLPQACVVTRFMAFNDGYVEKIDAEIIGRASMLSGAGRENKNDEIDLSAGIVIKKRVGDVVRMGDTLAEIHTCSFDKVKRVEELMAEGYTIGPNCPEKRQLIWDTVR